MIQFSGLSQVPEQVMTTPAGVSDSFDLSTFEGFDRSQVEGIESSAAIMPAVAKAIGMKVAKVVAKEVMPEQMHRLEAVKHGAKAVAGVAATAAVFMFFGTGLLATAAVGYTGYQAFKAHSEWSKGKS